ncbi:hypothetical protein PBRA_002395 [Plasmodiophora brassicae]|uniref:alcohol dehydrogenase n=1 Tax=Plasmodiophora brassicae TaxID=37360 RepID=A0A0G4J3L1_PLABS|nr:hypothetical protein PBRA_002395 [Plasmodiophora brassicae]
MATICGSDLHTITGRSNDALQRSAPEPFPLILGHEGVGVVVESRRDDCAVGQRVTWSVADSCGHCQPCTDYDLPQKCESLFKYGHTTFAQGHGLHGTYSSHVVIRRGTHIVPVPSRISDAVVSPANCALATVVNCLEEGPLLPRHRHTAIVQGAGLLGIYACAWLRHELGFSNVICVDRNPPRLELASECGAITVDASAHQADLIRDLAPSGADLLTGDSSLVKQGISLLRYGGSYVWCGMVHPGTPLTGVTGDDVVRKSIIIQGKHNYAPRHLTQAVRFLDRHLDALPFHKLVSPALPLDDLQSAIDLAMVSTWPRIALQP